MPLPSLSVQPLRIADSTPSAQPIIVQNSLLPFSALPTRQHCHIPPSPPSFSSEYSATSHLFSSLLIREHYQISPPFSPTRGQQDFFPLSSPVNERTQHFILAFLDRPIIALYHIPPFSAHNAQQNTAVFRPTNQNTVHLSAHFSTTNQNTTLVPSYFQPHQSEGRTAQPILVQYSFMLFSAQSKHIATSCCFQPK